MNAGIDASYMLMDTWFKQQLFIKAITEQGLDVIGMGNVILWRATCKPQTAL